MQVLRYRIANIVSFVCISCGHIKDSTTFEVRKSVSRSCVRIKDRKWQRVVVGFSNRDRRGKYECTACDKHYTYEFDLGRHIKQKLPQVLALVNDGDNDDGIVLRGVDATINMMFNA